MRSSLYFTTVQRLTSPFKPKAEPGTTVILHPSSFGPPKDSVRQPALGDWFPAAGSLGGLPHGGAGGQRQNLLIVCHFRPFSTSARFALS
jgi:hypothetical protein